MQEAREIIFKAIVIAALAAMVCGCSGGPVYEIEQGSHKANGLRLDFTTAGDCEEELVYNVNFDESCRYSLPGDQRDWNKLCGRSYGFSHQRYSARWAWRSTADGRLQIAPYFHIGGEIVVPDSIIWRNNRGEPAFRGPIEILPGTDYRISYAYCYSAQYAIHDSITGQEYHGEIWLPGMEEFTGIGYLLYPYFGGNRTAPHYMKIRLQRIHLN